MTRQTAQNCDRNDILIHIGYHKTASTWLQWQIFRRRGLGLYWIPHKPRFHLCHPLQFDAGKFRQAYETVLAESPEGLVPVLSNERLSGHPHSGGYDSADLAKRLKSVFPNARILIVIREQCSAIASSWRQYVKKGGSNNLKNYLEPRQDGHVPLFNPDHFQYDKLIALYQDIFGKDRVKVMLYENFKNDPKAFLQEIADYAGFDMAGKFPTAWKMNKSASPVKVLLKMRFNLFIRRDTLNGNSPLASKLGAAILLPLIALISRLTPPGINKRLSKKWASYVQEKYAGYFSESNKKTAKLTNLDLKKHEYQIPSKD